MVSLPASFDADLATLFTSGGVHVDLLADPRREAEAGLLQGMLTKVGFQTVARALQDPAISSGLLAQGRLALATAASVPSDRQASMREMLDAAEAMQRALKRMQGGKPQDAAASRPIESSLGGLVQVRTIDFAPHGEMPANAFAITFPQGVAWGFVGLVGAFGASLAEERRRGTMLRLLTAPVARSSVLLGKALGCFLCGLLVIGLLTATATLLLGVRVQRWDLLGAAAIASAFAFSGLAVGMAGFFRSEGGARSAGNAVVLVLAMVGGGTIPLAFMPELLRTASAVSPFSWSILAIEGAVWRGFGALQMAAPLGVLLALGVAGLLLARSAMHRSEA
jgi:ABC-2 type transport system permease protein